MADLFTGPGDGLQGGGIGPDGMADERVATLPQHAPSSGSVGPDASLADGIPCGCGSGPADPRQGGGAVGASGLPGPDPLAGGSRGGGVPVEELVHFAIYMLATAKEDMEAGLSVPGPVMAMLRRISGEGGQNG